MTSSILVLWARALAKLRAKQSEEAVSIVAARKKAERDAKRRELYNSPLFRKEDGSPMMVSKADSHRAADTLIPKRTDTTAIEQGLYSISNLTLYGNTAAPETTTVFQLKSPEKFIPKHSPDTISTPAPPSTSTRETPIPKVLSREEKLRLLKERYRKMHFSVDREAMVS